MSTYRLDQVLAPRSIALVGASPRPGALGAVLLDGLRRGGFPGTVHLVTPRHERIGDVVCLASLADLPAPVDLVLVASPADTVPAFVRAAGEGGCAGAMIMRSGLGHGPGSLAQQALEAAREHGIRLIGPNALGLIVPRLRLDASFAAQMPADGDLALISQSGEIAAGILAWAGRRAIGFSSAISLGDQADVDVADCLDHFATDRATRAILLYVETIPDARKFMSAARLAACAKPVVIIKGARGRPKTLAAATHTAALAGSDAVFGAAFRRAGLLRVRDLDELFTAAETLGRLKPFPGDRLAILSNGSIGLLAGDRLTDLGGTVAGLSPTTRSALDLALPSGWSHGNPVAMHGAVGAAAFEAAMGALLDDDANDAVLVVNAPTALASARDCAAAVIAAVAARGTAFGRRKPVLAVWIGRDEETRALFEAAGIPDFPSEMDALRGFRHLVAYGEAQRALMEVPASLAEGLSDAGGKARGIIEAALAQGRRRLDPQEVSQVLEAYAIPVAQVLVASDAAEAGLIAREILAAGSTVAVKILSPDIIHKSDIGGVALDLASEQAVIAAADAILARARAALPDARIGGLVVQAMVRRPKARELIIGLADDQTFGPVILFGHGGTAAEVIDDTGLALPPLDLSLAHDLIARTRVSRLLKSYRDVPAADLDAVAATLVKVSQMAADLPEICELDLNPILADASGLLVVDARIMLAPVEAHFGQGRAGKGRGHPRFAIRPYPSEWERTLVLGGARRFRARPIRPEDDGLVRALLARVTPEDLRLRFFAQMKEFNLAFMARLTQLDYARSIAFIALDEANGEPCGVVRLHADANHEAGEFAILLRSDLKGLGLGWALMELIIAWAKADGIGMVEGQVLRENKTMLAMCEKLGFQVAADPDDPALKRVSLSIAQSSPTQPTEGAGRKPKGPPGHA